MDDGIFLKDISVSSRSYINEDYRHW